MAMAGAKSNVATAMAIAGRASRACDVCGSQRARWFCAADDAYLCHRCDQNVHSANALSLRHERVRLNPNGSSSSASTSPHIHSGDEPLASLGSQSTSTHKHMRAQPNSLPSRKRSRLSRRPNPHVWAPNSCPKPHAAPPKRGGKSGKSKSDAHQGVGDGAHEVPSFITVDIQESHAGFFHDGGGAGGNEGASSTSLAEFFKAGSRPAAAAADPCEELSVSEDSDQFLVPSGYLDAHGVDFDGALGVVVDDAGAFIADGDIPFMPEIDLYGSGDLSDDDYRLDFSDIVGLRDGDAFEGDCRETLEGAAAVGAAVKTEGLEAQETTSCDVQRDGGVSPFTRAFPYKVKSEFVSDSFDLINKEVAAVLRSSLEEDGGMKPSLLRLNYDDVLSAWSDGRSLWTDGKRPQTVPDDSNSEAATGGGTDVGLVPDLSGREARVMRYREKRRTRLFSKKIRYEVRKLNAERRPRMKGRFVKRTPGCT